MDTVEEIQKKVEKAIGEIRPRLQMDGGDIKLVNIEGGVVKVELEGACRGCPMGAVTLTFGIERTIKQAVPEIKKVEAINVDIPEAMLEHFRKMQAEEA